MPFRQKVQIKRSTEYMANEEITENRGLHLDGPGSQCMLDERKRKWSSYHGKTLGKALAFILPLGSSHPLVPVNIS